MITSNLVISDILQYIQKFTQNFSLKGFAMSSFIFATNQEKEIFFNLLFYIISQIFESFLSLSYYLNFQNKCITLGRVNREIQLHYPLWMDFVKL